MAKGKKTAPSKRQIKQYDHKDKTRINNPPVGLVTPATVEQMIRDIPPKSTETYGGLLRLTCLPKKQSLSNYLPYKH